MALDEYGKELRRKRLERQGSAKCPNCDHEPHHGKRCTGLPEDGSPWCACNWPETDNYVAWPEDEAPQNRPGTPVLTLVVTADYVALHKVRGALEAFLADLELFEEATGSWRNRGHVLVTISDEVLGQISFEEMP